MVRSSIPRWTAFARLRAEMPRNAGYGVVYPLEVSQEWGWMGHQACGGRPNSRYGKRQ